MKKLKRNIRVLRIVEPVVTEPEDEWSHLKYNSCRILGFCGLVSGVLSLIAAYNQSFTLIGTGGFIMICGNLYAFWRG